ncbi:Pao retrotransposon peptidase family protein, partial [Aphelenchoides avenae]
GGYELKKYYVAIFVCMTYRCVHLELCSDLSTEQFLHALRRFGSRREYPARILSDNGVSFLTARQVINQIRRANDPSPPHKRRNPVRQAVISRISSRRNYPAHSVGPSNAQNSPPPTHPTLSPEDERLIDFCQQKKIEWQTITELSPWRGGVYERLIGLIKHCLRRSIGRTKPTDVEFSSLLAEAERTANSRPLSYIADSDTDFYLVRPLDILHPLLREEVPQNPLDPPIEEDCDPNDADFVGPGENRLHAKIVQGLKKSRHGADTFWTEFRDGYLADLRNRGVNGKNNQFGEPTIQRGDLVLIKEPDVPRCDWRLALVIDLLPDQDGLIRTAQDAMAPTTTSATAPSPDNSGPEALTTIEANTTQPPASDTAHSVVEAAQAPEPPQPSTTIGNNDSEAAHRHHLEERTNAIFSAIAARIEAATAAPDAATRDAILAEMAKETAALLSAGPRADPPDQEAKAEDSNAQQLSDSPPVAQPPNGQTDAAHSVAEPSLEIPKEDDFAMPMFPSQLAAQNTRGGPAKRTFRGGFGPNPTGRPLIPISAPQQEGPFQAYPAHSVGTFPAPNPTSNFARGNNSSRGSRGRGYVMKRPTAATRSSDLAPEFPDMDPLTISDQSETAKTPTDPEQEVKTDQPEATAASSIVETSDAETLTTSPAHSVGETIETSDAETIPVNLAHSVGTASVTISIPPSSTA